MDEPAAKTDNDITKLPQVSWDLKHVKPLSLKVPKCQIRFCLRIPVLLDFHLAVFTRGKECQTAENNALHSHEMYECS